MNLKQRRGHNPNRAALESKGLYHSFLLKDGSIVQGAMEYEFQLQRLDSFLIPSSLSGKRVLDIGPWDGFYSFEMERRGAAVVAIDYVDLDTFRCLQQYYGSKVDYRKLDVYEISSNLLGSFEIVLCLGVLYHLKYPIEGLERICSVTNDYCIIDTFVCDATNADSSELCTAEFYERGELAGQLDNWWGPSIKTVIAWARTAGFASVDLIATTSSTATFRAHRKWGNLPSPVSSHTHLRSINHHQNRGRTFQSGKEEYLELWFDCPDSNSLSIDDVFPEIDGFGLPPLAVHRSSDLFQASVRIPYGLSRGKHTIRVRTCTSDWSETLTFYMDPDSEGNDVCIRSVQDGISWAINEIDLSSGGWVTLWAQGLSLIADCGNTVILVNDVPHVPSEVLLATGQVNFKIRPFIEAGRCFIKIQHLGRVSNSVEVVLKGECIGVRGLENLR